MHKNRVFASGLLTLAITASASFSALAASPFSALSTANGRTGGPSTALVTPSPTSETVTLNVAGINSFEEFSFGDPTGNYVTYIQLAPFAEVTGTSWNVALEAYSPSWLSELTIVFTDSAVTVGVITAPGFGVDDPGTGAFADGGSLIPDGLNFQVGADGLLRVEFAEGFDDSSVNPDGTWVSGTFSFEVSALPVPEPATYGLMALGLIGVSLAARRRRNG